MRKVLFLFLTSLVLFCSCNGCKEEKVLTNTVAVLNVENTISTDREAMFLKVGDNYRWYESCILLSEFLDSENATSDPVMVSNVFQSIVQDGNSYDTWVFKFQHFADGTCAIDSVRGFWIEDNPLNEEKITLKYVDAYEKILEVNSPKPHSKQVCLRNPIGPVACNTQYVFGNIYEQLWVDAVTGEVKNSCPAFPEKVNYAW